jgi:Porin subfamily
VVRPFAAVLIEIKGLMGKLILLIALLPAAATAAEQPKKKSAPVTANPCAQYGAGWVQVQGTTTCVKLSGSVRIETGTSGPAR